MEGSLQPFDHTIQICGQTLKLIARADDWQSLAEVTRGDLGGFLPNFINRAKRTPHKDVSAANRERNDQRKTQCKRQQQSPQDRFDLVVWRSNLDHKPRTVFGLVRQSMQKEFMSIGHLDFM